MVATALRAPSALLPIALSVAAIAVILSEFASGAFVRETDEGTAAHLWQVLIAGQLPLIAFYALRSAPQRRHEDFVVLALQILALVVAVAPVFVLGL